MKLISTKTKEVKRDLMHGVEIVKKNVTVYITRIDMRIKKALKMFNEHMFSTDNSSLVVDRHDYNKIIKLIYTDFNEQIDELDKVKSILIDKLVFGREKLEQAEQKQEPLPAIRYWLGYCDAIGETLEQLENK